MVPHATKTGSAHKTGGIVDHRGRPYEEVPPPASFRSLVVNSAARLLLTAPCSSLSLTRFAFRRLAAESLLLAGQIFPWASHLAAGHVSDTPVKRGSDAVGGRTRQWFHQLRELLLLCK